MNATTLTVHWHNDNQPIYSIDFQPHSTDQQFKRLVTSGGDNNIRIWEINQQDQTNPSIEYISTLRKHTQAVNVVRFNKKGDLIASASDDGSLMLWRRASSIIKDLENDEDDEPKESWQVVCQVRSSTSEINDICWSPDGRKVVTGSMDNILRVYQFEYKEKVTGKLVASATDHSHYIQGVFWDPLNQYILSQSVDRSVIVYDVNLKIVHKLSKFPQFYSETLQSFFRRLCFSPDGAFMVTPAAQYEESPVVYVFTRDNLAAPAFKIAGINKPAIAVSFNPVKYQCLEGVTSLPYKYVFAIATKDSVLLYSTENFQPLGFVSNLHYSTITDLRWDHDGSKIVVSSADGFCSIIFVSEELCGQKYVEKAQDVQMKDVQDVEMKDVEEIVDTNTVIDSPIIVNDKTVTVDTPTETTSEPQDKPETATIDQFFTPKVTKKAKKRVQPTLVTE